MIPRPPVTLTVRDPTGFRSIPVSADKAQLFNPIQILQRLGVKASFEHRYEPRVIPVVAADAGSFLPLLGFPASAGLTVAPAINTRLADTGALAAGEWMVYVIGGAGEQKAYTMTRFAADNVTSQWAQTIFLLANTMFTWGPFKIRFELNERLVVANAIAAGVGISYHFSIWAQQL